MLNKRGKSVLRCACCGGEMVLKSELRVTAVYKCIECGLSDTKLKLE